MRGGPCHAGAKAATGTAGIRPLPASTLADLLDESLGAEALIARLASC
jgi:hypothetical protein